MRKLKFLPLFLVLLCIVFFQAESQNVSFDLYWENPVPFSSGSGSFPVSAYSKNLSVLVWQENKPSANGGIIDIALAVKSSAQASAASSWIMRNTQASYDYAGSEPSILSVTVDQNDRIFIAVGASTTRTDILVSADRGISFSRYTIASGSESSVAPRIFTRADGGYILFVTRGRGQGLTLFYALSSNGFSWSDFRPFTDDRDFQFTFLPHMVSLNKTDYVIFQSQTGSVFQLYVRSSGDGGRSWSQPKMISDFPDPVISTARPDQFDNERAHLSVQYGRLFAVWERRYSGRPPQIYGAYLGTDGSLSGRPQRINRDEAYCNNPVGFEIQGGTAVVWFDNSRGGRRVFMARSVPGGWEQAKDLSGHGGEASFARPVASADGVSVFWQETLHGANRIVSLFPDVSVDPPRLAADNFTEGRRSKGSMVRIRWNAPDDSSGIAGYSWSWTRHSGGDPPKTLASGAGQTSLEQIADEDGIWYFAIRAQDRAGNWSESARIAYERDTTPPPEVSLVEPETDEDGFLLSNTFDISWHIPPASDIAGFSWNLEYFGQAGLMDEQGEKLNEEASLRFFPSSPPQALMGRENQASYYNQDNGLWCFSVSAIDEVGNIGIPGKIFLKMNKYIAHTFVSYTDARQDEQGDLTLSIMGRGFADGGEVSRVILDRDGAEPYDREFFAGTYRVFSDREIGEIFVTGLEEGLYRIILDHPLRGLYMTPPLVTVDKTGTVKFGDFSRPWKPSWTVVKRSLIFYTPAALITALFALCALGLFVSIRSIASVMRESAAIRLETIALITGDIMPSEKKKKLYRVKRKGIGLRLKLASFTVALVLIVVLMVSVPLYMRMMRTREETLLKGIWDRSSVLLEGLASGARSYMPSGNFLELGYLPQQSSAIPEAHYVTITGYGTENDTYHNHVLATNDPDIKAKIDTAELQNGVSLLTDQLSPRTTAILDELNDRSRAEAGELTAAMNSLLREGREIVESGRNDQDSRERLASISSSTQSIQTRINELLIEIGREIGSQPEFSITSLKANTSDSYIFFKPVLFRQSGDDLYFRGLVRLEVGLDIIRHEVAASQGMLLRIILIVAFAAIMIGTVGALALSSLIIHPIIRLVSHVERIRDTENKSELKGVDIEIKSHDELAVLGNTINDMTHGLVKAAASASDLSIGKEIQKKFIPLDINKNGDKLTSGFKGTRHAEFFGYYEGAKGVSGDYFDYRDLDGRYFAIIKCDVAGKGIPAALIMIQVATMFLNYFKQWKPSEKGMHIEEVVYQINDFIETLAFKGRFAAFTLCLLDTWTGVARFCNAGDNIIHWYDASEKQMKTVSMRETPATGVLPNFIVESKGGYTVQLLSLDHGDILFLYTDGIEEAKRKFRNSEFREIICEEGEKDTAHETHAAGQGDEELGAERVFKIINTVMNRQIYNLHKYHNPEGENNNLAFDFSGCKGKVEEAIMAMVSVEKTFRMYKNPNAGEENRVLVDKKIDDFLKQHFIQYRNYCSDTRENPDNDAYMYYTHIEEDEQYDDLTILGIKRK